MNSDGFLKRPLNSIETLQVCKTFLNQARNHIKSLNLKISELEVKIQSSEIEEEINKVETSEIIRFKDKIERINPETSIVTVRSKTHRRETYNCCVKNS